MWRCTSEVPSTIWKTLASRSHFSTGWSRMTPAPPSTWTASVATFIAVSAANALAKEPSRPASAPRSTASAARQTSRRAASISIAISASLNETPCRARIGLPKATRSRAYVRRGLERGPGDADRRGRDLRARELEEVHRDLEAAAGLAEQPVGGDPRVLEQDGAGVRGAEAELSLLAAGRDAGVAGLDEEGGDGAVELGEDDGQIGDAAVRDVALLAVEDEVAAVPARGRLDAGEVRARDRLGEGDRRQRPVLARQQRQVAVALLVGAEAEQRPDGEHRRGDRGGEPGAAPGELLADQRGRHGADPAAAVLGRDRERGEPDPRRLREQLRREVLALVPLGRDRPQLPLGELVREPLQLPLLVGRLEADPGRDVYSCQ